MNTTNFTRSICLLCILFLVSCSDNDLIGRMEQIKMYGNENPKEALVMLDSLEIEVRSAGDYAKHKYDLLRVRLHDKADHLPNSDIMIKELMAYFEEEGSIPDKQEVYYYAGSTYRDLQDTPRALEYFFKSLDFAINHEECDPIMLRNTYSNLQYLFYEVQDYPNALKYGIKEVEMCKRTQSDVITAFCHLGASYLALDSVPQAIAACDSALAHIIASGNISQYQESLLFLLYDYSDLGNTKKAKDCSALIINNPLEVFSALSCMAFARYFESIEKYDSAAIYCKRVIEDGTETDYMYEAAKHLFKIYKEAGDKVKAAEYAEIYMNMSSEIDFGKRQELAATVNNQYQYHLDQKKEQQLKEEKERYKQTLIIVCLLALLLACIGYILFVRRKNRHAQQLTEQAEQNKRVIKMLHQSELEGKAGDVVQAVRESAIGKGDMTAADWKKLYQAVDELYPSFKDRLLQELGTFTEQQMQVCYLMRIGLSNRQIQNMTNLPRSTVWRWVKKYDWVHEEGKQ